MTLYADPRIALIIARQHQADVRASFPRRLPRPWVFPRPKPRLGGVTAVPALPDVAVPGQQAPQEDPAAA